jgi:dihydroxy-acid dehydratase
MAGDQMRPRSQQLRTDSHQGDALRLGTNWTEEDLLQPQVLMESAWAERNPGTFPGGKR